MPISNQNIIGVVEAKERSVQNLEEHHPWNKVASGERQGHRVYVSILVSK